MSVQQKINQLLMLTAFFWVALLLYFKRVKIRVSFIFFSFVLVACTSQNERFQMLSRADSTLASEVLNIKTYTAVFKKFSTKIITNGKVIANQEIPLSFQTTGIIDHIAIKNGSFVKQGQLLAILNNYSQKLLLSESKLQLDESRVEVNDQIIVQGGKAGDTNSISHEIYSYIKLRTGYNRALLAVQKAEQELSRTFLYAPISGIVANLLVTKYTTSQADQPICTLVNHDEMFLHCPILETELANIHVGQNAQVEAAGSPGVIKKAKVIGINPVVNAQGLIDVTIRITNPGIDLFSGMNARVFIENTSNRCLVVPKTALIERSGRKVIFTYINGFAKWNYVTLGQESDSEVTIVEGINEGDQVIISGNLNLGHDVKVKKMR